MIEYCGSPHLCTLEICKQRGCILNHPPITALDRLEIKIIKKNRPIERNLIKTTPKYSFSETHLPKKLKKKNNHRTAPYPHGHLLRFKDLIINEKWVPCHYCGELLTPRQCTQDHIIPRKKGGLKKDGIVPACKRCNTKRGHMDYLEFLQKAESMGIKLIFARKKEINLL